MDGYKKAQIKHFLPNPYGLKRDSTKQTIRQDRTRKILSLTEAISSLPVTIERWQFRRSRQSFWLCFSFPWLSVRQA